MQVFNEIILKASEEAKRELENTNYTATELTALTMCKIAIRASQAEKDRDTWKATAEKWQINAFKP